MLCCHGRLAPDAKLKQPARDATATPVGEIFRPGRRPGALCRSSASAMFALACVAVTMISADVPDCMEHYVQERLPLRCCFARTALKLRCLALTQHPVPLALLGWPAAWLMRPRLRRADWLAEAPSSRAFFRLFRSNL